MISELFLIIKELHIMSKIIVDNESIKYVVRYKYNQNNKVIDLSDLDTSKCTKLNCVFYGMRQLEEIKNFNTLNLSNVTDMNYMCSNCDSLKKLNLSGLDLHNVAHMSYMCNDCHSLKELNLSGINLHNVIDMSCMCNDCYSLKELNLSGLDLRNVIDTTYMCDDCYSLISFKVDEQYQERFKDIINEVSTRRDSISLINLNMLKIPPHEETMEELMNT